MSGSRIGHDNLPRTRAPSLRNREGCGFATIADAGGLAISGQFLLHASAVHRIWEHERPLATLRLALWFGVLAGLGEVGLLVVRRYFLHRFIFVGTDAIWMAPFTDAILFLAIGVVLIALRAVFPRRIPLPPVPIFAALATFTLLLMYEPLSDPRPRSSPSVLEQSCSARRVAAPLDSTRSSAEPCQP